MTHKSDTCEGAADDDAGEGRMDSEFVLDSILSLIINNLKSGSLFFCVTVVLLQHQRYVVFGVYVHVYVFVRVFLL